MRILYYLKQLHVNFLQGTHTTNQPVESTHRSPINHRDNDCRTT